MGTPGKYYIVDSAVLPEIFSKVVEVRELLATGEARTINEATGKVGISRSSYYKYKEDIFPFHDEAKGKTVTFVLQMEDAPGLLSMVLNIVAEFCANILTIHQSIPINGVASLTLSIEVLPTTGDVSAMIEKIEEQQGVHYLKILGRE